MEESGQLHASVSLRPEKVITVIYWIGSWGGVPKLFWT
jgi:hypothetical protein